MMNVITRKRIIVYGSILVVVLLLTSLLLQYETFMPNILANTFRKTKNGDKTHYNSWFTSIPTDETWCRVTNNYPDSFIPPMMSDYSDWSFTKTVKCPDINLKNYPKPRRKVSLDCTGPMPKLNISLTNDTRDIEEVEFGDPCLEKFIDHCCTDDKAVPNVIHHVLFGNKEFGFYAFLSFMSAVRFMRPCIHLIHGDYIPSGMYWDYFISISPNVIHVKITPPTEVYGQKLVYPEHRADVLRIDVVNKYGGVYTDLDEVLVQPIDQLRKHDFTMGEIQEPKEYLGCMMFMSRKNSRFINLWKEGYKQYQTNWGHNSQKVPYLLWKEHPDLINVEGTKFEKPGYGGVYTDWDEVLLKPIEPLRQYDCTMSELLELGYLGCAFFMAKKNSTFVQQWREGYKKYRKDWGYNSQKIPFLLSQEHPEIIHVEEHNFFKPVMKVIYNEDYNFTTNYGMHIPIRLNNMKLDLDKIRQLKFLIGAVCRHILYGNKDPCSTAFNLFPNDTILR